MYAWLLYFLSFFTQLVAPPPQTQVQYAEAPTKDYVGLVAVEAAYTTLLPKTSKPKPAPIDPANCPTCKGTGRVRTGDDQHWTKCPTCGGGTGELSVSGTCPPASPPLSSATTGTSVQPFARRQVTNGR